MKKNILKPILKWTGGKRREIKNFQQYIPEFDLYLEPFVGGGALYWFLENQNSVINDYDKDLMNFYEVLKNNHTDLQKFILEVSKHNKDHKKMESLYYFHRDIMDDITKTSLERAYSFLYVNKLCFSGMRRFNSDGKFNVPFGHYKNFNPNITDRHISLMQNTILHNEDGIELMKKYDKEGVFIFLDPPYTRVFKEYSSNNVFDQGEQTRLATALFSLENAKWMLIINDDENIRQLYDKCFVKEYDIKYGINVKNRFDTKVRHLIICNYPI